MGKTIRAPYKDTGCRLSNNTIKRQATSLKSHITHNGEGQILENHNFERLKCGSER